ncbi:putative Chromodomain-helicase-Dna-binding protein 3, partial [Cardiosporidium cionae]
FHRETVCPHLLKLCNQKFLKFDVLLTSYELFKKDSSFFLPIKWKCIVVDEGHRLKSWNSELKRLLENFTAEQRILMTGTPLQNTVDELFSLLNFLHPEKFPDNRKEMLFDITEEQTIEHLKRELQPHILRRIKKDVLCGKIPKKKEQIIRVENSKAQKDFYKRIYLKNREALQGKSGKQIRLNSLRNIVMQLRKCCNHLYLFESSCPPCNNDEDFADMLAASGKLQLLHRMLTILKKRGHRVLIFSQFMRMLDILEEYLWYAGYGFERLDGSTTAVDRQHAIDRFNNQIGRKFVFLLSTKAGGLGINLTSADTVIIYDSDWNPHNDLQAQARAHRLGQKKRVAIFRFVTRATVEERIVEIARNKLVLDQVITGRVKPAEVDYILKAGAKEIFSENAEDRAIYYDEVQLEAILDREENDTAEEKKDGSSTKENVEGTSSECSESEELGVLDAFKVAHYETIDINAFDDTEEEKSKLFWNTILEEKGFDDEQFLYNNGGLGFASSSNSLALNGEGFDSSLWKRYGRGCRRQEKDAKIAVVPGSSIIETQVQEGRNTGEIVNRCLALTVALKDSLLEDNGEDGKRIKQLLLSASCLTSPEKDVNDHANCSPMINQFSSVIEGEGSMLNCCSNGTAMNSSGNEESKANRSTNTSPPERFDTFMNRVTENYAQLRSKYMNLTGIERDQNQSRILFFSQSSVPPHANKVISFAPFSNSRGNLPHQGIPNNEREENSDQKIFSNAKTEGVSIAPPPSSLQPNQLVNVANSFVAHKTGWEMCVPPEGWSFGMKWNMQWLGKLVAFQTGHNFAQPIIVENNGHFFLLSSAAASKGSSPPDQIMSCLKPLTSKELEVFQNLMLSPQ